MEEINQFGSILAGFFSFFKTLIPLSSETEKNSRQYESVLFFKFLLIPDTEAYD